MRDYICNTAIRLIVFICLFVMSGCASSSGVREYGERKDLGNGFYITDLKMKLPTDNQRGTHRSFVVCYEDVLIDRVINLDSGKPLPRGRYLILVGLKYGLSIFDAKKTALFNVPQIPGVIVSSKLTPDEKGIIVKYRDAKKNEHEMTIIIKELKVISGFVPVSLDLPQEKSAEGRF